MDKVFRELLATYQGRPDKEWWSHIISYQNRFGSGEHGYRGWITDFLEGEGTESLIDIDEMTSGLVSVPLLEHAVCRVNDSATLVAGMLGFTVHTDETGKEFSVQPFQGWSLLLSEDSPFRK